MVWARYVAVIYAIGQMSLTAPLPPLLMQQLGLDWRRMYGILFLMMLPLLLLWLPMRETGRYRAVVAERQLNPSQRWRPFGLGAIYCSDVRYIALSAVIAACVLVFMVLYFWSGYFFMTLRG